MSIEAANLPDRVDEVSLLRSQVESLQDRVKELEAENAELLSRISSCGCHKMEKKPKNPAVKSKKVRAGNDSKKIEKKVTKIIPGYNMGTPQKYFKRYVALKVMYFGRRFYGFASEAQMDPTVESEIFKALVKTRLLVGDKKESQYSRCGRTDKGVSSVGQVIALVRILNRALPEDIRIIGWSPIRLDFSARFSCLGREYKYFFWRKNMNLLAMGSAGKKFIGEHDFRNFCKMDAANVHNYRRCVTSFEISPYYKSYNGSELCAIKINGSAFLWHQVRCMVAVLFMIGQGLESVDVIDTLLDTKKTPRKPQYTMAPEIPLILQSCEFEGLKFTCSSDAGQALRSHLENEWQTYQLQSSIYHDALLSCLPLTDSTVLVPSDKSSRNDRTVSKKTSHVSLLLRPTEPSYEERRAKLGTK
ncbi:tRNA pseudouridine(38/39) synthase [Carica papaya]|uniref:tRNA pseudouridine(38/39) synthase n=1 Tax=Carica papaya TaxID=3649 RepID=UPI000B8CB313|nr:tRNA pseudouridine(38/39) synthase [Carica papaya]